ncbi:thiamine pyrophosphokinase [Cryptococcus wingfieldii CBS 7118]|uniref:Thiamine pyrophosphokinase n=1 Tax=Cryptococcus wingfieldii CBS 7118 TaxID=1295528 RepID=A0A1E3IKU4_9TREE|nr:thiamine pyrophosphokinase [Cryptococcus wingfieldii CBS 7118]ODN89219.1 thiamine pyrophosphokinase [Cryptococcus wingfieldii CBS 7118]
MHTWTADEILRGAASRPYALIVLNQPTTHHLLHTAWHATALHFCADGGANTLYNLDHRRNRYIPDLIKGDLDSIRPEVRAHYASLNVTIKQDRSEYATDLIKCIEEVPEDHSIVLLGGLSGRLDQTVHTMGVLQRTEREVLVLDGESFAWYLRPASTPHCIHTGQHVINIDHNTMGQTCGILPVGIDSAHVITKGLKWDVDWETSLVNNLSTSNHLLPENPSVYIETDKPILWTVEVKKP